MVEQLPFKQTVEGSIPPGRTLFQQTELSLILHNLRSAHNVGAIFRTAEAAGVKKIFLTGYTLEPVDKFGKANKEIAKTALGAEKLVAYEKVISFPRLIKKLKSGGIKIVALEQAKNSVDYKKFKLIGGAALVLGNEVTGLDQKILKLCEAIIEIPLRGQKESLNVATAAGIAIFRLLGL